jgi:signal transduction histidine kinase
VLTVTVLDDGAGVPAGGRRSGLRNLAARAEHRGGSLAVEPGPAGGTRLVWTVPLAAPERGA